MNKTLQLALLGTSNSSHLAQEFLEEINLPNGLSTEEKILLQSSFDSFKKKTAIEPEKLSDATVPVCPEEYLAYPPESCSDYIWLILSAEKTQDTLPNLLLILSKLQEKKWILRPDVLQKCLQMGENNPILHPLLLSTVGERGKWLSSLYEGWSYLENPPTETEWEHATHKQRLASFENLYQNQPQQALLLLTSAWESETAAQKIDYLNLLLQNPHPDVLNWLQTCVYPSKERSADLKRKIVELAIKTDKSLLENLKNTLGELVAYKSKLLSSGKFVIETEKIAQIAPEKWGVNPKNSQYGTGNLADLFQIIALLPPSEWENQTQKTPEQLWKAMQKSPEANLWKTALQDALILHPDERWLNVLLHQYLKENEDFNLLEKMVAAFSASAFESFIQQIGAIYTGDNVMRLLQFRTQPWGSETAKVAVGELKQRATKITNKRPWDCHDFIAFSRNCAQFAPPDYLEVCRNELYHLCQQDNYWFKELNGTLSKMEFRIKILQLFS